MSDQSLPGPAACPGCLAPVNRPKAPQDAAGTAVRIVLSLPTIHCAACISAVETGLLALPEILSARVNLSQKQVEIRSDRAVEPRSLIEALAAIGYEAHALDASLLSDVRGDPAGRELLTRLAVAGFAMMNVMLLSVAVWAGAEAATRDLMHWISAAIALPAIAFCAQPFFRNAASALRLRRLNMDVPISLAIFLAAGLSLAETAIGGQDAYFDAALSLTFFLLAGRYLDYRTRASARSAAQELAALEMPHALRIQGDTTKKVALADLREGDLVRVHPGDRIPADCEIINGETEIDRAFLTGETLPVYAGPNTRLNAGEINLTGPLTVSITRQASESTLQRIAALVALAETGRNRYTSLADRAAAIYAPGVHVLALLAFSGWLLATGDVRLSINIAVAVLIITCPCALGLAVPAVNTAASGRLFRHGVLLKNATALERLATIDTVIFDKTGTLTLGVPRLIGADGIDADILEVAAALAAGSAHPLARAVLVAAGPPNSAGGPRFTDIREVPGYGLEGNLSGQQVRLGRADWVGASDVGTTATYLAMPGKPPVALTFRDEIRPGVSTLIDNLSELGIKTRIVTGDTPDAGRQIAAVLGGVEVITRATPEDKLRLVASAQNEGHRVLMVGDGLNDTGALARADVSVAPATAIDAARVAADIVILGDSLDALLTSVSTARAARRRIKENFALAALYNLIAVPFALAGLATPLIAALAMSASSITVTLNAWRTR